MSTTTQLSDEQIIEAFGGPSALARLFKISQPSVTEWKTNGIPAARRQTLELLRPEFFAGSTLNLAAMPPLPSANEVASS